MCGSMSQETCLTVVQELSVPGHEELVVQNICFCDTPLPSAEVFFGTVSLPVSGLIPCLKNTIDGVRDDKEKCNISG